MLSHQHGTPLSLNHEIIDLIGLLARAIGKQQQELTLAGLVGPHHVTVKGDPAGLLRICSLFFHFTGTFVRDNSTLF